MNQFQIQFLTKINGLSSSLRFTEPTIAMLIKSIWSASKDWRGGQPFEDAENFVYQRFWWRVKEDLGPDVRLDKALRLLASSIPLGILVFRDLDDKLDDPAARDDISCFLDYVASLGFDPRHYGPRYAVA
jgi:hypothetical protein